MDFRYAEEHVHLRDSVRRLLGDVASEPAMRQAMATERGWDPAVFRRIALELGALGLAVPEKHGGSGYGLLELGVVLQEAGRALLCAPVLSGVVALQALLAAGGPTASRYLPGIVSGDVLATVALSSQDAAVTAVAEDDTGAWHVTGELHWVVDGATADLLVLPARSRHGISLFAVDLRTAEGVDAAPVDGVDPTRRQARVSLAGSSAQLLGTAGAGTAALAHVRDVAVVLLAAEQLGVAERCLEMATEYAKQREQFDRPIGSFQAVKHKLADVLLEVEAATSAVMYALWVADERPEELPLVASITGLTASEAALLAAGENIQVHGGIGATWEHPAHLYLKRATTDRFLYLAPQDHLESIAASLDLGPISAP